MPLPVADQSRLLSELLPAYITSVRPLACVYQYVLLLGSPPRELFTADRAGERPDTLVDPQMKVQIPLLAERLAAGRAHNLLLLLVPQQMLVKVVLSGHATFAQTALERGLVMPVLHVCLQRGDALARVAAHRANDGRRVAVHLLRVLHHVVLYLELLPAHGARVVETARVLSNEMILQRPPVVALVLADGARVQHRAVNLFRVLLQVFPQSERLAARLATMPVLLHVRRQQRLPLELFAAKVALEQQPGLPRPSCCSPQFHGPPSFPTRRRRVDPRSRPLPPPLSSFSPRQRVRALYLDGATIFQGIRFASVQWIRCR